MDARSVGGLDCGEAAFGLIVVGRELPVVGTAVGAVAVGPLAAAGAVVVDAIATLSPGRG